MKNNEKTNKTKGSNTTLEKNTSDKEVSGELPIQTQNLLVDKHIKQQFPKSFTEQQNKIEEAFIKALGENIKYVKQLEGTPYNFTSEGLTYINEEDNNIKISNVLIVPIKKYNYKTEEETKSNIELKAIISPTGEELPTIIESIQDIENAKWYTDSLWWKKIRFELPPQKNIQIDCIKVLSEFMEEETLYKYVGFANEDGKKIFLHTGGAVGTDKAVKVDLENEVLNRFTLTNKKFDIKETLEKYSLKCLEVAPKKITQPIFSLMFTAPLTSTFEEVGIPLGFLTWVQGPPQSMKTSLVAAFVSHFGFFDRNSTPMSFNDKIPSAIQKLGKLKDVVVICDDYFASANKQEAEQMKKFAGELIQLCYDKIIGSRSKSNGEIRKTPRMKGQVIATRRNISKLKSKSYFEGIDYQC